MPDTCDVWPTNMGLIQFYISYVFHFLRFYLKAGTRYDVHSPFVAEFVEQVLEDRRTYYAFWPIEQLRSELQKNKTNLNVTDYGAGSQAQNQAVRSVSSIAHYAAVGPGSGRRLFRIAHHFKPGTILELGTSLGIGTLYLSGVDSRSTVYTIEGCPETAAVAQVNFKRFDRKNISPLIGPFDQQLPEALAKVDKIDLLYLDGDHRYLPSRNYFQQCLTKVHSGSVFIIADLYWSPEMIRLWKELQEHPSVRISIDLFDMGLLFFDESIREKQAYALIQARYKPWRLGLFPRTG